MILSNISRLFPGKPETSDKTIPGSVIFLADLLISDTKYISRLNQLLIIVGIVGMKSWMIHISEIYR